MRAFVTVGSTFFNELIDAALSQPVLQALSEKRFTHLAVQCGKYPASARVNADSEGPWTWIEEGIHIEMWRYKPTLEDDYASAGLIISHAGALQSSRNHAEFL